MAMITPDFARTMARYNTWQNANLYSAANGLGDTARRLDRGAFFGSIQNTLTHVVWADTLWMSRFSGGPKPSGGIKDSSAFVESWADLLIAREALDCAILGWADGLASDALDGDLSWFSGAMGRTMTKPLSLLVAHFFNHQTHHRGQVHAMLTAAGARPEDTDLFIMPETGR
jgi:uncharacterized damage-inducible protein DinB